MALFSQARSRQHRCYWSRCQSAVNWTGRSWGTRNRLVDLGGHLTARFDRPRPPSTGTLWRFSEMPSAWWGMLAFRDERTKCNTCCFWKQSDRLEILRALSSHLTLNDDVNLEEIAKESENYSGADIQAILYTAQLKAINQLTESECPLFIT